MSVKLSKSEDTVRVELKMSHGLKAKALDMAAHGDGDGNLSSWLRSLIRREWEKFQDARVEAELIKKRRTAK